jgi:hypothetical protein
MSISRVKPREGFYGRYFAKMEEDRFPLIKANSPLRKDYTFTVY